MATGSSETSTTTFELGMEAVVEAGIFEFGGGYKLQFFPLQQLKTYSEERTPWGAFIIAFETESDGGYKNGMSSVGLRLACHPGNILIGLEAWFGIENMVRDNLRNSS